MTANKIIVPDILPNNIKNIREMRGLTTSEVAEDMLKIDTNFYGAVEAQTKNFSGKTTIRTFVKLDINFYKMYDVKEMRVCPVTSYEDQSIRKKISIDISNLPKEMTSLERTIEYLENKRKIIAISRDAINEMFLKSRYKSYEIVSANIRDDKLVLDLDINFGKQKIEEHTFNIDFAKNEDVRLADMLFDMPFGEEITIFEFNIKDGDIFKIKDNKVILEKEYKIPNSEKDLNDYKLVSELKLEELLDYKRDEETGEIISIKFRTIRPRVNKLKEISVLTHKTLDEMANTLDYSYHGFVNLTLGAQKFSSKVMWKLVYMINAPLESFVNIDEYYERYCRVNKKIRKPNRISR